MIGVISKKNETEIVKEFFELFKTPWEFYKENQAYSIILSTQYELPKVDAKLIVIYSSEETEWDRRTKLTISTKSKSGNVMAEDGENEFPVYGFLSTFEVLGSPIIQLKENSELVGQMIEESGVKIVRIGFDIFEEVKFLLSKGQPPDNAHIPTLDIHIYLFRKWILKSGIPVLEIPPIPEGHNFFGCLTHDVDFIGIKHHKFDHAMWGFLYRATLGSLFRVLTGRISLKNLLKNWMSVVSLPLIYLGIAKDFWFNFDKYTEIEKDLKSTFFIIPFKNKTGEFVFLENPNRRKSRYDISDIQQSIKKLINGGFEIGLHGIDAWHDIDKGKEEFKRISNETKESIIGTRMHWLCFNDRSTKVIDEVGFYYDSTYGYNETIGYRGGTAQVFRPPKTRSLFELPLHIQDMALFALNLMNLSEIEAWNLCNKLISNTMRFGGVLTLLWHMRSIAPERLWGDFYFCLLETLKENKAYFGTAKQVVNWFQGRRALTFKEVHINNEYIRIVLDHKGDVLDPKLLLRIHLPEGSKPHLSQVNTKIIDIPWSGETEVSMPLN